MKLVFRILIHKDPTFADPNPHLKLLVRDLDPNPPTRPVSQRQEVLINKDKI